MTRTQLHGRIGTVCQHFDLIRRLNPGIGHTLALDFDSLSNPRVRDSAIHIEQISEAELQEYWHALSDGLTYWDYQRAA